MTDPIGSSLNADGHEIPSDKPLAVPAGFQIPETLNEQVARLVRHERFNQAMGQGDEDTFDEADDFDVGEDFDPFAPHEQVFDPVLQRDITPAEFIKNQEEYRKLYHKAAQEEIPDPPISEIPPGGKPADEVPISDDEK